MKKLCVTLVIAVLIVGLVGCNNIDNTSSNLSYAEPSHGLGLYTSSAAETSQGTAANASAITSSGVEDIKGNLNKFSNATVRPSEIDNPTGIVSVDRKDNYGDDWQLSLVNPWNTLHTSYKIETAYVDSRFGEGKLFDARAVDDLNAMCEAASLEGVSLSVISAFRTFDYQQMLYDNEVNEYKYNNPNCSEDEALREAATVVARPGTSEHNLGLAVDFNSVEQSFENTEAYKWLSENCTKYGFIMRYSAIKQDITGVIYEPWHYRYVGKENAKKIAESGLTLEEYLKNNQKTLDKSN